MEIKTFESMNMNGAKLLVPISVPQTVEEYDTLARRTGAALEAAINNEVYRGVLADVRELFCERLESALTADFPGNEDVKRKTKVARTKKGADGNEEQVYAYDESEAAYVRRLVTSVLPALRNFDEVSVAEFQPIMDQLLAEKDSDGTPLIAFDPTRPERVERGPKKLPQFIQKAAESIVASGKADAFIAHYGIEVRIAPDADEATTVAAKTQAIGWKIKQLEDAEKAKQDTASKYAGNL